MTQKIITVTIGAGQARPRRKSRARRRVRVNVWAVVKYAALTVAGILLFRAGAAHAYAQRGYFAVGGEVFALLLPLIYYAISSTVRDIIADVKNGFQPNFKEENDHEKTC